MKLTEFSVKHWQFTVVLFVMLAALGVTSTLCTPARAPAISSGSS